MEKLDFVKIENNENCINEFNKIYSYKENMKRNYLSDSNAVSKRFNTILELQNLGFPWFLVYSDKKLVGLIGVNLANTGVLIYYSKCSQAVASEVYHFHNKECVPMISAYIVPEDSNFDNYGILMIKKILQYLKENRPQDNKYLGITTKDDDQDIIYLANEQKLFKNSVSFYVKEYDTLQSFSYCSTKDSINSYIEEYDPSKSLL